MQNQSGEYFYAGSVAWHEMEQAAFKFERNYEKEREQEKREKIICVEKVFGS